MDFFARGAYHRAKKIIKGPKKKKRGTRVTVGMDGVRRKRKKKVKDHDPIAGGQGFW